MESIAVSVIIPVYNVERYLRDTLDSVCRQTLKNIEIICVNDGSSDASGNILAEYAQRDARLIVIDQANSGAAAARNRGMEAASGDYLAILDSDDVYEPEMLEIAFRRACADDADIVVFRCDEYYTELDKFKPYPNSIRADLLPDSEPFAGTDIYRDAFKAFIGWSWDKLFKRLFIKDAGLKFQEIRTSNDMYFVFSAIARAQRIVTVDNVFVHHRKGVGGLAETREKSWSCFHEGLTAIRRQLEEWDLFDHFERDYVNYCLHASFWNHDTLAEPAKTKLRDALVGDWFREFGIAGKDEDYFYNKREYMKYRRLMACASPKVSIVIPSLNSMEYYDECIDSALAQDMEEIEVLCVDAGSTDGTRDVIASRMKRDPRVRSIDSSVRSYGHQMNLGFAAARGEYLMVLESDDYISEDACSFYYGKAVEGDLDFVKSDHAVFFGIGDERTFEHVRLTTLRAFYGPIIDPSQNQDCLYLANLMQPGVYKRDFILSNEIVFNESPGASYQDNGFWFQVFTQATRAQFSDKVCYYLRRDNPDSSVQSKGKVFAMCDEYDFIRNKLIERGLERFLPICAHRRFGNYQWTASRIGDYYRPEYFERFAADFRELEQAGELDRRYFSPRSWSTLREIMNHGSDYYYLEWYYRESLEKARRGRDNARKALAAAKEKVKEAKAEAADIRSSRSYRIGEAVLAPARALRRCFAGRGSASGSREDNADRAKGGSKKDVATVQGGLRPKGKRNVSSPFESHAYEFYSCLPESEYGLRFAQMYARRRGAVPDLANPKSYSEKALSRKVSDPQFSRKSQLSDAHFVKEWASSIIGSHYVVSPLGVWDSVDEIDFDSLTYPYTLKCNHGHGFEVELPKRKSKRKKRKWVKAQLNAWMQGDGAFCGSFDLYLRGIKPRVFAVPLELGRSAPKDIWVWCFSGRAHFVQYTSMEKRDEADGNGSLPVKCTTFFDPHWAVQPFSFANEPNHREPVNRPRCLSDMVEAAELLAAGFDHVNVHFLLYPNGEFKFDDLSFACAGGFANWFPAEADYWVGALWDVDGPMQAN